MSCYRRLFSVFSFCVIIFFLQYLFPPPAFAACSGIFCGVVFIDSNGNGVQDSGEQSYVGATVTLNSNGSDVESQQTTSSGYSFSPNVCTAGNYTVTLAVPSGYNATTNTSGSGSITTGMEQSGFGPCASHPLKCSVQQYCTPVNGGPGAPAQPTICIPQTVCFQDTTVWNHKDPQYAPSTFNFGIRLITYSLSGNVSDNSNAGVAGVRVTVNGTTVTTDANGNYTVSNLIPASYTVSITVPTGYIANGATSQAVTLNANKTGVNFKLTKVFQISGTVYNDTNENGRLDSGEAGYQGITVKITNGSGTQTITSPANGAYSFQVSSTAGNSTVTISGIPAGWFNSSPSSQTVPSTVNTTGLNFGIAQENTISGNVFVDPNKNGIIDSGESNYPATPTITSPDGGSVTTTATGTYTIRNLLPGTYTVTYGAPPAGYYMTSPLTGPPISFRVTVGSACSTNSAPGAACAGVNITNLNFGVSNDFPWFQSVCGDIRNDNGITDNLPAGQYLITTTNGTCLTAGLAFTGDTNANLKNGSISSTQQAVGGQTYPEIYSSNSFPLETSYPSLSSKATTAGITPVNVASPTVNCTNLSNCTLPANLPHGIYIANGNLTLNAFTAPANQDYVLLVSNNLTINGPITVPVGSTLLISVNGTITVNATVGAASPTNTTSTLDGWYVAGGSFIITSAGGCNDKRLNIAGAIVVNALGNGGTFTNSRDLCGADTTDPTVSFTQRLDMLLNAPSFIQQQQTLSQEVNP